MKPDPNLRLIDIIVDAFNALNVYASLSETELLANIVYKAMAGESRYFHTTEHILRMADSTTPIQALAALFHDIVYHQVDSGFVPDIHILISPYIQEKDDGIFIADNIDPAEKLVYIALDVFGFSPGQKLAYANGLNEFLSTLVMAKSLERILPVENILRIIICIEATIPFRGINENGEGPFEILEKRIKKVNQNTQICLSEKEIETAIQSAVLFANKDVESFRENDPAVFLVDTWKLIPETNVALRSSEIYTIRDYRIALQKTDKFFNLVNPGDIFHCYKGVPPDDEYRQMVKRARSNISTAREYLGVKLLAIAILEALAEITGGDAPLSLFMGGLQQRGVNGKRIEDFLPPIAMTDSVVILTQVFKLLETGRAGETNFDMSYSPLSGYLYKSMGMYRVHYYLEPAQEMFSGKKTPLEFLEAVDSHMISIIASACAEMVPTRREQLLQYAQKRMV